MLKRIYEAAAYEAESLAGCYWTTTQADTAEYPPLRDEARAEFAVIGAGYTGLSAALELARSGGDVAVLDLHHPGWGASGRNGGFCCTGGLIADRDKLIRRHGRAEFLRYRRAERDAIAQVRQFSLDEALEIDMHSQAGEVQLAHRPRDMAYLRKQAQIIWQDHGLRAQLVSRDELAGQGLAGPQFHGGLIQPLGFALNPRKYALGLAHAVLRAGGRIHADSPVLSISRRGEDYVLQTPSGRLLARHLLLATNGYSADNLPDWIGGRYLPVQSSVIVTRPLTPDEIAAQGWHSDLMAYDTRHLLHYFRLMPDRRFLFGMRGGISWASGAHQTIRARITADFRSMFPAWGGVALPYFWSGLANLTRHLTPYVGAIDDWPRAHSAFGYHGNGVAMASWCGRQMARLAMQQGHDLPAFFQSRPARFELGRFRRMSLALAYGYYGIRDR
jgi:glycine/D-amino acid oxidase-like deaminating enzyme